MGFYLEQNDKVQTKFDYVSRVIRTVNKIPEKFLKHLEGTNGLYEISIEVVSNIFRVFCCFDKGNPVVPFNAFQMKTQKTPKQEIELAEKLKKEYFFRKSSGLKGKTK